MLTERPVREERATPERLWAMIAAVQLPTPPAVRHGHRSARPPDDDNWESLNSFELVLRAKAGDDRARDC